MTILDHTKATIVNCYEFLRVYYVKVTTERVTTPNINTCIYKKTHVKGHKFNLPSCTQIPQKTKTKKTYQPYI